MASNMEMDTLKDCERLLTAHQTFRDAQMKLKDNPHDEKNLRALEIAALIISQFNHPKLKKIGQDAIEKVKSSQEEPKEEEQAKEEEQPKEEEAKKEEEIKEEANEEVQSEKKKPKDVKTKKRKSRVFEILNPRHWSRSKKPTKSTTNQTSKLVDKLKNLLQRSRIST